MGQERPFKVVIVGASVAGLSLANMLQANDIDYVVLESYLTIAPQVGASIGLLPHGNRILDQLGLFDRIMELAPPVGSFSFRDENGSVLATYRDMDQRMIERHGYPLVFLDRQMLLQVLYDNIKDKSKILTNKRVVKVELGEDSVRAVTVDKSVFQGDIIVGADGIHSTIRDEMWRLADGKVPSEREAPPCDYSSIFGISDPCPGILPGDLYGVFRNKSSYLLTGGPGGRVYWFRFQKLLKRLYGSDIPRYTESDLAEAIKESADDQILPGLRFSTLIKNKVSAVLTPLPEHVYNKWHHDRIFLLGDSAHKFHPIGGHGGNAAIETAAALTNDLVEALNRSSPNHLETSQLASIFAAVQKRRLPRLKAIERYSHNRQLTESLDSPLQKLIALHLLPLVGESYVTLSFSAQFPGSEKLNGMDLPHRQKLVPYKDELLAEPKSKGRMQRALIVFYLTLSVIVYYGMWVRSASWGLHEKVAETVANGDFPDGPSYPLKRTYVGVQVIDDFLVLLAAMFVPGLRPWNKSLKTVQMYLLGHLIQPITILVVEGYRDRNRMTVLALPIVWFAAFQLVGIGIVLPVYCAVYTVASNPEAYWWPSRRFIPLGYAHIILAACFVGYLVPTVLMFWPWSSPDSVQNFEALWQLSPMLVPLLTKLLGTLRLSSSQQQSENGFSHAKSDLRSLKQIYIAVGLCGILLHWYNIVKILTTSLTLKSVFFPDLSAAPKDLDEALKAFFQVDLWGYCLASYMWCVQAIWDLRRVGRIRVGLLSAAMRSLAAYVVLGPGAAIAAVWYVREDAMACTCFGKG